MKKSKIYKKLVTQEQEWIGSLYNYITIPSAVFLSKVKWATPNLLSVAAFLSALIAAGFLLYQKFIFAAIFLVFLHYFDAIDGKVARMKGLSSDLGAWYDVATGYTGYLLVFIAFIFAFNGVWPAIAGIFLLAFYSLIVIVGKSFYSIISKSGKKAKMIKNKKWYMRLFGVTLIPVVLIITTLIGRPWYTVYFFGAGYLGQFIVMLFFQYTYLTKT